LEVRVTVDGKVRVFHTKKEIDKVEMGMHKTDDAYWLGIDITTKAGKAKKAKKME
jgi:hypothetical protein